MVGKSAGNADGIAPVKHESNTPRISMPLKIGSTVPMRISVSAGIDNNSNPTHPNSITGCKFSGGGINHQKNKGAIETFNEDYASITFACAIDAGDE